ncbi:glycosyltransferase family A protein [Hyphomicrobium sp. LHD-15]|uniref:glycosyltransferase family 2 protein n=1 Tax=Hyphomicrobium sp. LHD-15 TaxID=3072142 RepID=UPI00280E5B45|nr:glycosyltransferase family A protein [Hyphomicrobium sp. LHD-15]MDQ8698479.1 glycosyltransferase family A protein [Hyphomicrobium sp. LHD-15]
MSNGLRIAITVCTRDRRELLQLCLESILRLEVPQNIQPVVVVVENNASPASQVFVEDLARGAAAPWKIIYGHEPTLGIPIARNRSLDIALREKPDWIAFVDDDETVDPKWLERMLVAAEEFRCDVLHGPVEFLYPDALPDWFDAKQTRLRPRGLKRAAAATNNTFVAQRLVSADGLALRFDETMRFTGGSDTEFFLRAAGYGATIRWVDDAWVRETVGPSRLTMKWQWMRALRGAVTASRVHRKQNGLGATCIRYLPKALTRLVSGLAIAAGGSMVFLLAPKPGRKIIFLGGKDLASGLGTVMGLMNVVPEPYKTVMAINAAAIVSGG